MTLRCFHLSFLKSGRSDPLGFSFFFINYQSICCSCKLNTAVFNVNLNTSENNVCLDEYNMGERRVKTKATHPKHLHKCVFMLGFLKIKHHHLFRNKVCLSYSNSINCNIVLKNARDWLKINTKSWAFTRVWPWADWFATKYKTVK